MSASDRFHCPRCATTVAVEGPGPADRLRFGAALLSVVAVLGCAPLLGFALIFAAPVLLVVGIGVGSAASAAFAPRCCATCGCEVTPVGQESPATTTARVLAAR